MSARVSIVAAFVAGLVAAGILGGGAATGAPTPESLRALVAATDPSIVHVTTRLDGDRTPASRDDAVGAGFVLRADGWIVTSRHVLQGARKVLVDVEGRGVVEARIVGVDDATDVALLKVEYAGLRPMPIAQPAALAKGDWVLAVGSPFRMPRSWSVGIVSGLGRSGVGVRLSAYEDFIQTDAAANVGNSGGPLVDLQGRAVGMMTAILSRTGRSEGVGLAVPIDVVVDVATKLMTGRSAARPTVGVVVRETPQGLLVTRFQPASPARAAGLKVGDLILQVDGIPTTRTADLQRAVWAKSAGTPLDVIFIRQGRRLKTSVRAR